MGKMKAPPAEAARMYRLRRKAKPTSGELAELAEYERAHPSSRRARAAERAAAAAPATSPAEPERAEPRTETEAPAAPAAAAIPPLPDGQPSPAPGDAPAAAPPGGEQKKPVESLEDLESLSPDDLAEFLGAGACNALAAAEEKIIKRGYYPVPRKAYPVVSKALGRRVRRVMPTEMTAEDTDDWLLIGTAIWQFGLWLLAGEMDKRETKKSSSSPPASPAPPPPPPSTPSSPPASPATSPPTPPTGDEAWRLAVGPRQPSE
jgi:hypothetical protein